MKEKKLYNWNWQHKFAPPFSRAGIFWIAVITTYLLPPTSAQENPTERIRDLNNRVSELYSQGEYKEAITTAKQSLRMTIDSFGADHSYNILPLNNLAVLYMHQGMYDQAEPLYFRALELNEKQLGPDHPNTAQWLNNVGLVYINQGKYQEAESMHARALKIRKDRLGAHHPLTAESLTNLAGSQYEQGKYQNAEPLYLRALEIREQQLGPNHLDTTTSLGNLAQIYKVQGKYEEAEPLYLRALKAREQLLGTDHPETAVLLNGLAGLNREQGKHEEAEALYFRALEIREKKLGWDHPDTAISLANLAGIYESQGKYTEAEPLFLRALEISEKRLGVNHPAIATTLSNLAGLYKEIGNAEESILLYTRALKIAETQLGIDHQRTATVLNNLGALYREIGEYRESEPLLVRALKINEQQLGPHHPDTATSLDQLARLYYAETKIGKATDLVGRSLLVRHLHQTRMLGYFTDRDCLAMQAQMQTSNQVGNSLDGELAATEQIWFKGAVIEGMNQRRIAESALSSTEKGAQLLQERQSLMTVYQKAFLQSGTNNERTKTIESQLTGLEKQIAVALQDKAAISQIGLIDLSSVRKVMSEKEVLVESFRYDHDTDGEPRGKRYSTSLIRTNGKATYIAHGSAKAIEDAIEKYRRAILNKDGSLSVEERQSLLSNAETFLYQEFLSPIEAVLSAGTTVIFSLDAQLHFMPLAMLRDESGIPFGEKYFVRYVTSGRDLVKEVPKRSNGSNKKRAIVLGNPTYRDNAPLMALAEGEQDEAAQALALNLRAGVRNDTVSINLQPLPGTAREAAQLESKLKTKGYLVTSLSAKGASEEAVRQSIEGCDVVHLATHGFFLDEIQIGGDQSWSDGESKIGPVQDPMYRSGLALSGAQSTFNLWKNGEVPPPSKDGILMAVEAALLDLRGTDLVVLSACETGAGEALDGEGVMGLRRALSAAGATNTIMTLWPVDDQATVEVMDAFYEKYLSGIHPAVALAEVQIELYQPFVEKYGEIEAISRLAPFICTSIGKVEK